MRKAEEQNRRPPARLHIRAAGAAELDAVNDATGFFAARGMTALPADGARRDYPHRFWLPAAV